jgi:predicted Na+-dependent transporter
MSLLVLAQSAVQDSSSGAGIVFLMLVGIGITSALALTPRGRRSLMPAVAILIGLVIVYSTLADAFNNKDAIGTAFTVITVLGLFIGVLLVLGGFGALREGIALPPVEGREPEIEPSAPRITPNPDASDDVGADSSQLR